MGYDRHHAIIVTSKDAEMLKAALDKADALGMTTTGIVPSPVNGWASFFVAPDGSKEGWDASDDGDAQRNNLVTWLDCQRWEDDSTRMDWVEVQYGDDELDTRIVSDSDQRRRDRRARDEAARRANPADRTILNLRAQEWFTIAGRGRIAVIDTAQIPGPPITVGDHVRIDNVHYEVLGIESEVEAHEPTAALSARRVAGAADPVPVRHLRRPLRHRGGAPLRAGPGPDLRRPGGRLVRSLRRDVHARGPRMRVALTAGESMDLVLLHDDGTRTDVRIENDPDQSRPVITAINQRRRAPLVVLVNGERKLP